MSGESGGSRTKSLQPFDVIAMLERDRDFAEQTLEIVERQYNATRRLPLQLVERLIAELRVSESIRLQLVYPAAGCTTIGDYLSDDLSAIMQATAPLTRLEAIRAHLAARRSEDLAMVVPNLRRNQSTKALTVVGKHYAALRRKLLNPM